MDWFDSIAVIVVSWGHRYLVEAVTALVLLGGIHWFLYPIAQKRAETAKLSIPAPEAPLPSEVGAGTTITTGAITTYGSDSGIVVGLPQAPQYPSHPPHQKGKGK